jgi:hypothetical protein
MADESAASPKRWKVISEADIAIASVLALSGILMAPLPWRVVAACWAPPPDSRCCSIGSSGR